MLKIGGILKLVIYQKYCIMIFRFPTLVFLLTYLPQAALCAEVERINSATLVDEVFRVGPINSFLVQQAGRLLIEEYRGGMHATRATVLPICTSLHFERLLNNCAGHNWDF